MNLVLSRDLISYLLDAAVRPVVAVVLTIFGARILLNNKYLIEINL
jgi:hypothetical protein